MNTQRYTTVQVIGGSLDESRAKDICARRLSAVIQELLFSQSIFSVTKNESRVIHQVYGSFVEHRIFVESPDPLPEMKF